MSFCNGLGGGDLAICDAGARKVHILSRYLIPVHSFETEFMPDWRIFEDADALRAVRPDVLPVSVAFSPDRLLCVGYRDGGIIVHRPYHIAAVGRFVDCEVSSRSYTTLYIFMYI